MKAHRNQWFYMSLAAALTVASCTSGKSPGDAEGAPQTRASSTLTIKGSDTMVILAQTWAQAFMDANPGKVVQVSGGGSGTGLAALINGTANLANASRPIKDTEQKQLRERRGAEAKEFRVALDALAVYVPVTNKIESLTIPQLKKIFRGETTNWKDVGGDDRRIVLYSRENSSGTYAYFKEHVLDDEDFAATAQTLPGTAAVINAVSKDPSGIGYGGIAYAEGVRTIKVAPADGEPVEPSMANATSGKYPLSRFLNVYSVGEPTGVAKEYLDFVLSAKGQEVVKGVGYYPLPKEAGTAAQ
ncbi:MAG: phosphate ABC transporter substrate-binding protein [Polyangiales bacterium]|jgi:phosphate transport system substrate-binding protein